MFLLSRQRARDAVDARTVVTLGGELGGRVRQNFVRGSVFASALVRRIVPSSCESLPLGVIAASAGWPCLPRGALDLEQRRCIEGSGLNAR